MSIEATSWVYSSRVGDTTRKFVLAGFANHAHKDGRHAWPGVETIAEYVERSERSVQRAVRALVADGWMREGDQQQVAHLRGDRRPTVYDLAMNEETRLAWRADAAGEQRGDTASPRPDSTGRQDVTPPDAHGVTHGVTPVTPRGDTGVTQTVLNPRTSPVAPTGSETSDPSRPTTSAISTRTCQRHGTTTSPNCRGCGTTTRQIEARVARDTAARRRAEEAERVAAEKAAADAARVDTGTPRGRRHINKARAALAARGGAR